MHVFVIYLPDSVTAMDSSYIVFSAVRTVDVNAPVMFFQQSYILLQLTVSP